MAQVPVNYFSSRLDESLLVEPFVLDLLLIGFLGINTAPRIRVKLSPDTFNICIDLTHDIGTQQEEEQQ